MMINEDCSLDPVNIESAEKLEPEPTGDLSDGMAICYEAKARAKYAKWHPSDGLREEKVQSEIRSLTIEDALPSVPDEAEMRRLEKKKYYDALASIPPHEQTWGDAFRESETLEDGERILHFGPPQINEWGQAIGRKTISLGGNALAATNPDVLSRLPLEKLGVPVGDPNGDDLVIEAGLSWKTRRTYPELHARKVDFFEFGWPSSAGNSLRWVTGEEENEINRRFSVSGLTMPGSEAPLVSKSLLEIMESPIAQPKWLIVGILREGGAMMLFGPPGVGKTWFTHTLALMAAHGKPASIADNLISAGDAPPVKVLIIDGEMILSDLKARTAAIFKSNGQNQALENIRLYAKSDQDPVAQFIDLAQPAWKTRIIAEVKNQGFSLVIFDNLSTLSPSLEDENSAVAWNPLNDLIVALKHEGVASLIVHHTGKGGKEGHRSYRGSSNLATTLETILSLEKVEGEKFAGARFKIRVEKARNPGAIKADGRILQLPEETGVWESEIDEIGEAKQVLEMIMSLRYPRKKDLGEALGLTPVQTTRLLDTIYTMELATEVEVNAAFAKAKKLRDAKANAQDDPSGGEWEPDLNDPEMLRKQILTGLRIL